jgi:hypothetical protein
MPRLRNIKSGVVVSCSDTTAARLGSEWQPADSPKAADKPAPARKAVAKKAAARKPE